MAWRDCDKIANTLKSHIKGHCKEELKKTLEKYSEGIAKELADLEKRIHDLERRGR